MTTFVKIPHCWKAHVAAHVKFLIQVLIETSHAPLGACILTIKLASAIFAGHFR